MDWKAVDPTESTEVTEVIELLDVSFPIDRDYIEREVAKILSDPEEEGQLYRLRSPEGDLIATVTYGAFYGDGWAGETFIRFLAVHPDHRRKGHASWMIEKIKEDAQACESRCIVVAALQRDKIGTGIWQRRGFTLYATDTPDFYPEFGPHDSYVYWFSE